jgi:hypothetical protein
MEETLKTIKILNGKINLSKTIKNKELYTELMIEKVQAPKVISKNPGTDFSLTFKAITNRILTPMQKEHIFYQIHNILPTKDRLIRCRQDIDPNCNQCGNPENLWHIFICPKTLPATKYVQRKIEKIYNYKFFPSVKEICLLQFPPNPKKSQREAIHVAANFTLTLWKTRKKPRFMEHFIPSFKYQLRIK